MIAAQSSNITTTNTPLATRKGSSRWCSVWYRSNVRPANSPYRSFIPTSAWKSRNIVASPASR